MLYKDLLAEFRYSDERGSLVQLVSKGYSQVNVLKTNKGVTRGGHFHKLCHEAFYIVSGSVSVKLKADNKTEINDFSEGDFFEIAPYTEHEMYFPESCTMIALYDIPVETISGKDIYRSE